MRVYVINLKRSEERRAQIHAQMLSAGIAHDVFDGIEGLAGAELFSSIRHSEFLLNTGRQVSAGEIGCYASHLTLWMRCAMDGEPIVVMEDDARLSEDAFAAALQQIAQWIADYGFIRLQTEGPRRLIKKVLVERAAGFDLFYCAKYPEGAMCYAISPQVARVFVERGKLLTGPVDMFIKRFWVHRQPLFALTPAPVCPSELSIETTIMGRVRPTPSLSLRILQTSERWRCAINRARFNRAFLSSRASNPWGEPRGPSHAS